MSSWGFVFVFVLSTLFSDITVSVQAASPRWEPQIAVLCEAGQIYHPQYLSEEGKWMSDLKIKVPSSSCLRDKIDLLDHCKKVYPGRDITNIVESPHYQKIGGWCRQGVTSQGKCKGAQRWIKPFRCLEGPFQSDALLVPEGCLFDHIHNASRCWPFVRWNQTGAAACQDRGMQMRSFAMLLPCGISLFSGVEFVCCPKHFKDAVKVKKIDLPAMSPELEGLPMSDDLEADDDDDMDMSEDILTDEDGDDEDDYDSDEDTGSDGEDSGASDENWDMPSGSLAGKDQTIINENPSTMSPSTTLKPTEQVASSSSALPTVDPYFTHFDPRLEHQSYKEAQQRLEEAHREKVTRVMKDWSDLEEKYQDMRLADPKAAQSFKQRMTARFQTSVQALEEEGNAEKHQLAAMHQQRVLAHINQRKREAMTCYTQALTEQPPNAHRVEKCLQKLLRALHKDRAHALAHYRHLLSSGGTGGLEAAASERSRTLERLIDIDRAVNQSLSMLKRYPDLSGRISQLMDDYIQALRSKDETPGSMLAMTEEAEAAILDKYRIEVERKVNEKERQRLAEKQRKEKRAQEREKLREEKLRSEAKKLEATVKAQQQMKEKANEEEARKYQKADQKDAKDEDTTIGLAVTALPTVDDAAVQRAVEEVAAAVAHQEAEPRMQHALAHDLGHGEAIYSVRREVFQGPGHEGRNVYFTLAFAGIALMAAVFVGVAVAKWRASRSPQAQGFIEVDQVNTIGAPVTPEERHVANMQINGYENPTYKYFEVKD
ncbi:amyloid-beta-like protein isoform X1 [Phlebotomus papatasi]|uniref:amyloid-beta-like protein isoform X1 n=1 Tax=Phlebotomus papatasi TaxID=29031 RepID=UPI0024844B13|nr:amyloid-beta-like protein isoform X1 [Phlebotomus papatasi]